MKYEKRYNNDESFRAFDEDGKRYLEGYAAKFDVRSKLIFENKRLFTEILQRGSFDDVLASEDLDVILTFNHSRDKVMARTTSGTLELKADDVGLFFRAELPTNVSYANDTYELVTRGDLNSNSFAFFATKEGQTWERDSDGQPTRTITQIARLSDVSVVTSAAYPNTELAARAYEEVEDERTETTETPNQNNEVEILKLKTQILKIK